MKCEQTPDWGALQAEQDALQQTVDPTAFFGCEPEAPWGNAALLEDAALAQTSSSSGSGSSSTSTPTPTLPAPVPPAGQSAELDRILREYQVREDTMTEYSPALVGWMTDPVRMTQTEVDLLGDLQFRKGLMGLYDFKSAKESAYAVSGERFQANNDAGLPGAEDGHQDAFRHIYWNVLMTREFGPEFAAAFGSAHEGVPGNPADREAMDLYNNEIGRTIAQANPDATEEELQELVMQAITDGQAVASSLRMRTRPTRWHGP